MARTRRQFLWHYQAPFGPDAEFLVAQAERVLAFFCTEWPEYYGEYRVTGYALGLVELEVTVYSRDRWWVAKRVRRLLTALERDTEIQMERMDEVSQKLAPHTHRGKRYLREQQHGRTD